MKSFFRNLRKNITSHGTTLFGAVAGAVVGVIEQKIAGGQCGLLDWACWGPEAIQGAVLTFLLRFKK